MTWEDALSLAGSKVSKRDLWAALIPSMGFMAQLRNLRNFDDAGVPDEVAGDVIARLTDPEQVARSRQFPFRFLSAYRAAPSLRWSYPLERALSLSLANVPALKGRTLVLVDRSGSMFDGVSAKSGLNRADTAALFGVALALRSEHADLVEFGTQQPAGAVPGSRVGTEGHRPVHGHGRHQHGRCGEAALPGHVPFPRGDRHRRAGVGRILRGRADVARPGARPGLHLEPRRIPARSRSLGFR